MSRNKEMDTGLAGCFPVDDAIKKYYLPVMYGIIFTVGFVGNVTSLFIYLVKLRPWKSYSIIMVNLAVADLLYVMTLPFLIQYYIAENWTTGEFMCKFVRFGFHFNLYGSILFLTCLSVFRYVVVVHPLRAAQVQRTNWGIIACLAVWLISLVEITPMLNLINVETRNNKTFCPDFASNDPVHKVWLYGLLLTILGYLLPLVMVCWTYTCIAWELAIGPHTGRPSRVRARKLTVLILMVFVLCFMPYHILRYIHVATRMRMASCMVERGINAAYTISRPLAGLNTFFNLALYTLAGDRFHQALLSFLPWRPQILKDKKTISVAVVDKSNSSRKAQNDLVKNVE